MFARIRTSRGATVLGELLMLVVGINLALWFEGKFDELSDIRSERQYLQGLHDDLTADVEQLDRIVAFDQAKAASLAALLEQLPTLHDASPETQAGAMFEPSTYEFFEPSDFTYRSMQESGDFRLLRDPATKNAILKLARRYRTIELLQQNFIQALDDGYIPLLMRNFDIAQMRLDDPGLLAKLEFRNFFAYGINEAEQRLRQSEKARDEARALLELIEAQIR